MKLLRPRSLSSLVLLALAIIALPLIAALVTAGVQMRQLSAANERIVAEGAAATRTQELLAQSAVLERLMGVYQRLGDPRVLEGYAKEDATLREVEQNLAGQLRQEEARVALREFTALRTRISGRLLDAPANPPDFEQLLRDFAELEQLAGVIATRITEEIDAGTAALVQSRRDIRIAANTVTRLAVPVLDVVGRHGRVSFLCTGVPSAQKPLRQTFTIGSCSFVRPAARCLGHGDEFKRTP